MTTTTAGRLAAAAAAVVAVTWGVAFTVVDQATTTMAPADLVFWRFGLGTLVLCLIPVRKPLPSPLRTRGIGLGALLGAGFLLQAWALTFTDALMSGFLTSMLVVIAPIAGWLMFRDRLTPATGAGVFLAAVGLALLTFRGAGFGPGEWITLAAAGCWGVHVVLLSRWSEREHALALARVQTAAVTGLALVTIAVGAAVGGQGMPSVPADSESWAQVAFLAVVASAGAMVLLSWAQARLSATRTAVLLALEPAAAGLTAALTGAELGAHTVLGAGLLLAAMCVVELGATGRRTWAGWGRAPRLGTPSLG